MAGQFNSSSSSSASLSSNSIGSTSLNAPMTSQQQLERLRNLIRVHLAQSNVNHPTSQAIQPLENLNDFMRVHLGQPNLNEPASQVIQPLGSLNDLSRVRFGQNETRASQLIHHDAANEHVSSQRWISNLPSGHQQVSRSIQYHPSEVVVTEVVRTTRFLIPPQTMRPRPYHLNVGLLNASTTMPRAFPLNGGSLNISTTPTPTIRSFSPNPNTSTLAPRPSTSNDYSHVNVSTPSPTMESRPLTPNPNLSILTSIPISSIPAPSETQGDGMTHSLPHSKHGPYTCPRCNSEFPTSQKFAAHMGSHYKHESKEETLRRRVTKYRNRPYYRNGVRVFLNADGSETSSSAAENVSGEATMSEAAENVEPATNTPTEVTVKEEPTTDPPQEDNNKDEPTPM